MLFKDVAYNQIKEKLLEEEYAPGTLLSEKTLIDDLKMSKTPIKSALIRLEAEGFVTVSSKQGVLVNDLTIDRINNIYNLRIALETFNCEQIYSQITKEQLEHLWENLEETKIVSEKLDVKEFASLDHGFHLSISEIAGNDEITRVLLNYQDHLLRITLRHLRKDPSRVRKFYQEHVAIMKALEKHEKESIRLMRQHLQESKSILFQ
ncbi:GntR family transcriptional regulator [Salicibibacter cibarius]|uniref:GntR family transcriptional regulator n=2 Tax=Salicibibacter cibarius TaxID=2743000 RepID=A0A7T7CDQ9_9BACI|nr:GntR family transcriptional regulator [Salicibibacter cibarius]